MAVSVRQSGQNSVVSTANGTTSSVTLSSSPVAGNLFLSFGVAGNTAPSAQTGFTLLDSSTTAEDDLDEYRVVQTGDSATQVVYTSSGTSNQGIGGILYEIQGQAASGFFNAHSVSSPNASSTSANNTVTTATITPTVPGCLIIAAVVYQYGGGTPVITVGGSFAIDQTIPASGGTTFPWSLATASFVQGAPAAVSATFTNNHAISALACDTYIIAIAPSTPIAEVSTDAVRPAQYNANNWIAVRGLSVGEAPPAAPKIGRFTGVDPAPKPIYNANNWLSVRGPSIGEAPPPAPKIGWFTPDQFRNGNYNANGWVAVRGPSIGEAPPAAPKIGWFTADIPRKGNYNSSAWIAPWTYFVPPAPFVPIIGWFTGDIRRQPTQVDRWFSVRGPSVGEAPPPSPIVGHNYELGQQPPPQYNSNSWQSVRGFSVQEIPPAAPTLGWFTPDIVRAGTYNPSWSSVRGPSVGEAPPPAPTIGRFADTFVQPPRYNATWLSVRGPSIGEAPPAAPTAGWFTDVPAIQRPRYTADKWHVGFAPLQVTIVVVQPASVITLNTALSNALSVQTSLSAGVTPNTQLANSVTLQLPPLKSAGVTLNTALANSVILQLPPLQ